MEDCEILELYFARDESAIKETANTYGKRLDSLSFGILKDTEDAKEAVNETYLKTWNTIPPQRPSHFYAFIAKICRHLCFGILDYQKAQKRNAELLPFPRSWKTAFPTSFQKQNLPTMKSAKF